MARIVQGAPISWDSAVATIKPAHGVSHAAWSPCSRFVAISLRSDAGIQILDAVTLKQLKSFIPPHTYTQLLTFSPDGHLLTWVSSTSEVLISWDIQTGLLVSKIPITEEPTPTVHSVTYSGCGTMLGMLFKNHNNSAITTYNVISNMLIHSHPVEELVVGAIWTCGEYVQFTTLGSGSITIWEVGFTSKHPPTEVKSLPTPNNIDPSGGFHFLPTHSRLAFVLGEAVIVWDAQLSKPLLDPVDVKMTRNMTFSPNGHFFACEAYGSEIYLWKESPTGYILHQKLVTGRGSVMPLLSPNGQLIVGSSGSTVKLWHTTYPTTPPSSDPIQLSWDIRRFALEFSPDRSLAVTARLQDNVATVLDLRSGTPQLIIDTGTSIYGLKISESVVVIVGDRKIITWNLPIGDQLLDPRVNINNSVQTTIFADSTSPTSSWAYSALPRLGRMYSASISPDFNFTAFIVDDIDVSILHLIIFDTATGKYLTRASGMFSKWGVPWFTQDGSEVWYHGIRDGDGWRSFGWSHSSRERGWKVVKAGDSNITAPSSIATLKYIHHLSGLPPWQSPHGHQVTDDGWILSCGGKRLLLLPHHWQSSEGVLRTWGGQFLAFLHNELPEAVILELLEG